MRAIDAAPLPDAEFQRVDAFWRAANYLAVGQIYLLANPLLREPLRPEHIKPRLLGHWGTVPGLTLAYAHLSRLARERDLNLMYVTGPGHGGAAIQAATWLEGSFSETYPSVPRNERGMARLFKDFSFPGGMPSHVGPEVPGSINEGGELGYSLAHAYGAAFDNPGLVVGCVVADGEAETGPLATAWHSTKFLDPVHDGAVLPILHLNGHKIANPSVLARIGDEELARLLEGCGHTPYLVEGDDPPAVHQSLAATLDQVVGEIHDIQLRAREGRLLERPRWPMVVLRTPKGWTGPEELDGLRVEGTWRSHQIPLPEPRTAADQLAALETWMGSYQPGELFDEEGRPSAAVVEAVPRGHRRIGANPHANGGLLTRDLDLPALYKHAVEFDARGRGDVSPTQVLGGFLRDVLHYSDGDRSFRLFCPDELQSNKLDAVYEATDRAWNAGLERTDAHLARGGRIMEMLSEHTLQGWLEGYLLTGRHGLFASYEAFIHLVDSMFNQHAKWLKVTRELDWRRPIPSLTYLLSSHVWQQDHNGFSHQDPGFIDHVVNKKADLIRVYLPPDANTLLWVTDRCLRSRDHVNVIVAGKQNQPTWLDMDEAVAHCTRGLGIWEWASNDDGEPDVVMACAGDAPTRETLAAVDLLHQHLPDLRIRVINVVDLMRLQPQADHPHGLGDAEFDALFTLDRPVIFAYHGYPWLIHRLTYRRANHRNLHVRGYKEEGTTTTPFDMAVRNDLDRFGLVMDVVDRVPGLGQRAAGLRETMIDKRTAHDVYTRDHGEDLPEVRDWRWPG